MTHERVRLQWATAPNNLGNEQLNLNERRTLLHQAIGAGCPSGGGNESRLSTLPNRICRWLLSPQRVDGGRERRRLRLLPLSHTERSMRHSDPRVRSMDREYDNAIFVALELSRSNWLIAINLPHTKALLSLLSRLKM